MGQKTNPIGFRLGVNRTWDSRWFASGDAYARLLHQDLKLRTWLKDRLKPAGVSRIIIERPHKKCRVTVYAARPGVVIGKKGADIEKLRRDISARTDGEIHLNIVEIRKPETDAQLIAENIAQQLERRIAFRRAMKRSMQSAMRLGAKGVRINVSGRLGGAEIARMEWYREGRVPLHTLRADIDYGFIQAKTTYGIIGVKVWVFKGEVLEHDPMAQDKRWAAEAAGPSSNEGRGGERGGRNDRGQRRGREEHSVVEAFRPMPLQPPPKPLRQPATIRGQRSEPAVALDAHEVLAVAARLGRVLGRVRRVPVQILEEDMGEILAAARHGLRLGLGRNPLRHRAASIVPALLDGLVAPEPGVRWGAAYAIAALVKPDAFPGDRIPAPHAVDGEAVRRTVRLFLANCGATVFTEVSAVGVRRTEAGTEVRGVAGVTLVYPDPVGDGQVALAGESWITEGEGVLEVFVGDDGRTWGERFSAKDPIALASPKGLKVEFTYPLRSEATETLHLSIKLNGRWVGERAIPTNLLWGLAPAGPS